MIAAIYARVSTDDQDCSMQLSELRDYVVRNAGWKLADIEQPTGWNIHPFLAKLNKDNEPTKICAHCGCVSPHARHTGRFAEYVEAGVSGTRSSRPELNRLKADARMKRFDVVLVWKMDRFGRSLSNLLENIQLLDGLGIRFIAPNQGIDTDNRAPVGRLLLHIMGAFAEFERALIVERVCSGMASAKARGVRLGRKRVVFDRDRARLLQERGFSLRSIAHQLGVGRGTIERALSGEKACPKKPPDSVPLSQ